MTRAALLALAALAITKPALADAYDDAAARYGLDPTLLRAVALKESDGRLGATNRNSDGSEDICAMQINSQHLPTLAHYGITRAALLADLRTCVTAGAWLLAGEVAQVGPTWLAVCHYHTGPKGGPDCQPYANAVFAIYNRLRRSRR